MLSLSLKKNKHSGFTLIELMVVMAMIAILATAGLSAYTNFIDKAIITKGVEFAKGIETNLVDKLVLKLDFDGNAIDTSGYNNTVTAYGGTYASGVHGQGLNLSTTYVSIADNTVLDSSAFTISTWIKPNVLSTTGDGGSNPLFTREQYTVTGFRVGLYPSGKVTFWTTQSGGNLNITSIDTLRITKWNHIAITYDGSQATIYVNGKKDIQRTGTYLIPIGRNMYINVNNTIRRDITYDDVRFYTSSLLVGDIEKIYRNGLNGKKYVADSSGFWQIRKYRSAYNRLTCCNNFEFGKRKICPIYVGCSVERSEEKREDTYTFQYV